MSLFLKIPTNPEQYSVKMVALAAWQALQAIEAREASNWMPEKRKRQSTAWQVDRANTWQVIQLSKGFELFSYFGEDSTAAKIVELIPELLLRIKEKDLRQKSNEDWNRRNPVQYVPNPSRSIVKH